MSEVFDGKHWVEDLFPPAYGIDDVIISDREQGQLSSTVFSEWLRDWLPFPRARRVVKRNAEEQTNQQETDRVNNAEQQDKTSLPTRLHTSRDDVTAHIERSEDERMVDTQSAAVDSSSEGSVKESVWTWNELCALREHYDNIQSEKINLELRVSDMQQQLDMSTRKLSELFHVAERQFTLIQKMRREIEQLRIKITQQNEEKRKAKEKSDELDCDRERLAAALQRAETKSETLELIVADKEQQIFDLNVTLHNQKSKEILTAKTAVMSLEEKYAEKVKSLTTELAEGRVELERCREAHKRDKTALDQLRKHFADQSLSRHTYQADCMSFVYIN
ncbi:coiled-coil domain-containing protein 160 homolog [Corticium candelabrum]|uniref:coiled-coil domain-containing protein 160 homolog n=1 Tax=Corticium candelabrum TaxID=121492 RepID=UPI002E26DAE7|nr:coiled-coil domain-containing protein 160 homolog [Corticium candelabrum]